MFLIIIVVWFRVCIQALYFGIGQFFIITSVHQYALTLQDFHPEQQQPHDYRGYKAEAQQRCIFTLTMAEYADLLAQLTNGDIYLAMKNMKCLLEAKKQYLRADRIKTPLG